MHQAIADATDDIVTQVSLVCVWRNESEMYIPNLFSFFSFDLNYLCARYDDNYCTFSLIKYNHICIKPQL